MDSALHFLPGTRSSSPTPCIGVFDSGVGGLSILRALRHALPLAPLLYVADSAHAPYGERSDEYVLGRSRHVASHLLEQGALGLVVACNTATAIAAQTLRDEWPGVAIVGVEPGVKPAAASTRNGRIGVMATPATLASEKFQRLLKTQARSTQVFPQACPGLARLIERGDLNSPELHAAIDQHTKPLRDADVDTVVLGCTHYAFVHDLIAAAMGEKVRIIDTAEAVARHAAHTLRRLLPAGPAPSARLQTTGSTEALRRIASAWLAFACVVEPIG